MLVEVVRLQLLSRKIVLWFSSTRSELKMFLRTQCFLDARAMR